MCTSTDLTMVRNNPKPTTAATKCITTKPNSVTFAPNATMYWVLHINDYTEKERTSTWYSDAELRRMKRRLIRSINRLNQVGDVGSSSDEDCHCCSHGLESFTMKGLARKEQYRTSAYTAVMEEQDRQDICGYYDDKAIASAYQKQSYESQLVARARGIQHRMAALSSARQHNRPSLTRQGATRFKVRASKAA